MARKIGKPDEEPTVSFEAEDIKSLANAKTPWSGLNSIITEEEIKNAKNLRLVTKILLGEISRLGRDLTELKIFKEDYYKKSEELAVLTERLIGLKDSVTVRSLLYAIGGLLGGLIFVSDLEQYRLGIFVLCVISFALAFIDPDWLHRKK